MAAVASLDHIYTVDVAVGSEQNAGSPLTTSAFCGTGVPLGTSAGATGTSSTFTRAPYVACDSTDAEYYWPDTANQNCGAVGGASEARLCCCLAAGEPNPAQKCALTSADCDASATYWDAATRRCVPWAVVTNAYNDIDGLWQNVGTVSLVFSGTGDINNNDPWFKLLLPTSGTDCGTVAGTSDSQDGMHARMVGIPAGGIASGTATVNAVYTDIKICWSNTEGGTYADPTDGPRRLSTFAADVYIYNAEHATCVTVMSLVFCCELQTKIVIAPEITTIKANAFELCSNVVTVDFQYATNLVTIENQAFWNMTALTTLAQFGTSTSVTSIGAMAFNACPALAALTLPSSVLEIRESSFYGTALEQSTDVSFNGVDCCAATLTALKDAFIFGCPTLCPYAAWDFAGAAADTIPDAALSGVNAVLNGGESSLYTVTYPANLAHSVTRSP
jgi:hypothetical protein